MVKTFQIATDYSLQQFLYYRFSVTKYLMIQTKLSVSMLLSFVPGADGPRKSLLLIFRTDVEYEHRQCSWMAGVTPAVAPPRGSKIRPLPLCVDL